MLKMSLLLLLCLLEVLVVFGLLGLRAGCFTGLFLVMLLFQVLLVQFQCLLLLLLLGSLLSLSLVLLSERCLVSIVHHLCGHRMGLLQLEL